MVQQGRSVDLWYRETRRTTTDDTRRTKGFREETTVHPRDEELENYTERERRVVDDPGCLPVGVLCITRCNINVPVYIHHNSTHAPFDLDIVQDFCGTSVQTFLMQKRGND